MNSEDVLEDVTDQLRDGCVIGAPMRDVVPAHFTFRIESFSLLSKNSIENYESNAFEAQGYKWNLSIYPNGNKNDHGEKHISLYLGIADLPPACEINASFRFFVFDQIRDKYLILGDMGGITRRFHQMKTEWGFPKLLSLTTFQDASNGYLVNDTCVFGVEILVCKNNGCGEILSMIENSITQNHTWKIEKISLLKDEHYSELFSAGDHKWNIILYPKGNDVGENNSLSMFLKLVDSETCCTKVYASYKLRLINQIADNHLEFIIGNHWFISDGKAWGLPKFIDLNELNDMKKGFLVKDTCIVEAQVTILGVVKKLPLKST